MALSRAASRVPSAIPSAPNGFTPNCFRRNEPTSFGSNSAIFTLPAPQSTHKNDLVFSIRTTRLHAPGRHHVTISVQRHVNDGGLPTGKPVQGQIEKACVACHDDSRTKKFSSQGLSATATGSGSTRQAPGVHPRTF